MSIHKLSDRGLAEAVSTRRPSAEEVLAWPPVVDLETARKPLLIGRSKAYQLAATGEFPVKVLRIGTRYRVIAAEVWALLGLARERN
jgi:hypothetical protein